MIDFKKKTIEGIAWYGSLQAGQRVMGYLKIAILARILTPEQFGIFGIAGLALAFLEVFTQTGINVFLIQNEDRLEKYLDTAFVISIIRGILIGAIIFALSPLISSFFKADARLILYLISVVPVVRGFINPAIVKFRKELDYKKDFILQFGIFAIDALVVIVIALIIKNEISFVIGMIIAAFVEVLVSQLLIKQKPRVKFEMEKFKKVLQSGKWVTFAGIMNYLITQLDDIFVGRLLAESSLGLYQNAYKISTLPMTEVTQVINKATFPVLSKSRKNLKEFKDIFIKTSLIVVALSFLIGAVVYLFPREVVLIILGDKWISVVPVLKILAIFGFVSALNSLPSSLLLALKRQDLLFYINFVQLAVIAISVYPFVKIYGITGAAYAATLSVLVSLPFTTVTTIKVLKGFTSYEK